MKKDWPVVFRLQHRPGLLLGESEEETEWDKESPCDCSADLDMKLWREVQSQGHPVDESYTGQNWPGPSAPTAWVSREGSGLGVYGVPDLRATVTGGSTTLLSQKAGFLKGVFMVTTSNFYF